MKVKLYLLHELSGKAFDKAEFHIWQILHSMYEALNGRYADRNYSRALISQQLMFDKFGTPIKKDDAED